MTDRRWPLNLTLFRTMIRRIFSPSRHSMAHPRSTARWITTLTFVTGMCLLAAPAWAANTWIVTNTSGGTDASEDCSSSDTGTSCSLSDAITAASSGDTIQFASTVRGTITLTSALPTITVDLTITGPGANLLTISGNNAYRVFYITLSTVSISGLTIANGYSSGNGDGGNGNGGGIFVDGGTLTVSNSTFFGNYAELQGGGIYQTGGSLTVSNSTFSGNSASAGGGIENAGHTLTVSNSTFSGNSASAATDGYGGGGIENIGGTLTVSNSTFTGNSVSGSGSGGGIFNGHGNTLTVSNSTFSENTASGSDPASGIYTASDTKLNLYNSIVVDAIKNNGGTYTSSNNITSSTGLKLSGLGWYGGTTQTMIPLAGSTAICAGSSTYLGTSYTGLNADVTTDQRGFAIKSSCTDAGAVQTNYLTVNTLGDTNDGACPSAQCSLRDAITVANSTYSTAGVDIDFSVSGTITLASGLRPLEGLVDIVGPGARLLTVSGNNSSTVGSVFTASPNAKAALSGLTIADGNSARGGGIYIDGGTLTVMNSTLSGNKAIDVSEGNGGGIYNNDGALTVMNSTISSNTATIGTGGGGIYNSGTLTVTNSTISGNTTTGKGGGIYTETGTLTVGNSTISGNSADDVNGGIYTGSGRVTVSNSIVAGNTTSGVANSGDCTGCGTQRSYNLINTDQDSMAPPALSALQYNGTNAATQTMLPLPGSTAICAGSAALTGGALTDQRGFARQNTTYTGYSSTAPCVDLGAAQTNYTGVKFDATLTQSVVNEALTTAPTAEVDETNTLTSAVDAVSGVPLTLSFSGGSGEIVDTDKLTATTAGGVATFSGIKVNAAGTGDYFTTTISVPELVSGSATTTTLTATSGTFDVTAALAGFTVASSNYAQTVGAGFAVTVTALDAAKNTDTSYTGTPTLTSSDGQTVSVGSASASQGVWTATVTLNKAGTLTLTATDGTVTGVSSTYTVSAATPSVTVWPTASAITYGETLASSTLTGGTASVAGSFAFTTPTTTPTSTASQSVTFTPTDTTNYSTVTGSVSVTVSQAAPIVSAWPTASAINYGQTLTSSTLTGGTASVAGSFAFTTPTTTPAVGTASQSVTFTPTDTTAYSAVTGTVSVKVTQATPTVSAWPTAIAITYGQTLASSTLTGGTASVAGSFAFTTPTTAPSAGTASQSVTFTPTDTTDYSTVTGSVSVTVNEADFTLTPSSTTTQTVIPGNAVSYTFSIAPDHNSYAGTVSFTASGLPTGATATFSPATISATGGAQTVTMTIQTATATAQTTEPGRKLAPLALALLFLPLFGWRQRRRMGRWLCLLLLAGGLAVSTALTGCGGSFFSQAAKDYTVTVNATAGSLQHSFTVTLNVQ